MNQPITDLQIKLANLSERAASDPNAKKILDQVASLLASQPAQRATRRLVTGKAAPAAVERLVVRR